MISRRYTYLVGLVLVAPAAVSAQVAEQKTLVLAGARTVAEAAAAALTPSASMPPR
jgi:hypothetical protein